MVFRKPITMSDILGDAEIVEKVERSGKVDPFSDEWEDYVDDEPLDDFEFGEFKLVGHGDVTNEKCGAFSGYHFGCLRVDLHNKITLDGKNYAGLVYVKKAGFHSCDKPSCPICYKWGWAVREAHRIVARLREASKRHGQVEHVIATFPPKFWHLPYEKLRDKCTKILKSRGVIGGVRIWHGARFHKELRYWYFSPHFHCLAFVLGGMRKCRRCPKTYGKVNCAGCNEFWGRTFKAFEKDSCIVKVKGKRKTVGGTAWYILNHATHKKDSVRFQIATWFGVVSTRKMKVTVELRKSFCPICRHDLEKIRYNGWMLDSLFLLYARNYCVPYVEQPKVGWLAPEAVWSLVVSSGSYKYRSEDY